jgi:hypothetical protein
VTSIKRRTGILALGLLAVLVVVGAGYAAITGAVARADAGGTPVEVGAFGCIAGLGGHSTVPAGSTIVIRNGWSSTVFGSQRSFLDAQTSILSVNDGPMVDVSDTYAEPEQAAAGRGWTTWLRYPTGVTLASPGDSMRFTFALVFDRPLTDASDLDGDGSIDPTTGHAGLAFGGTCIVTAR